MRNAMKKFVAAVLTLAMMLSLTTVAFAGVVPTPSPPGTPIGATPGSTRDAAAAVSLRVHHFDTGNTFTPPVHPGANIVPPGATTLVYGSMWRMQQVHPPANFDGNVPSAVIQHVMNPTANPASGLPDGWVVTSGTVTRWQRAAADQQTQPTLPITTPGTAIPAFFANGAVGGADVGSLANAVANPPSANRNATTDDVVRGTAAGATQGLWIVWEIYQDGGPHTGNPDSMIMEPFVVNLPTFVHHPVTGDTMQPVSPLPAPGVWVYDVNVYPKPPQPSPFGKGYDGTTPGLCIDGHEVSILSWYFNVGISEEIVGVNIDPAPSLPPFRTHGFDYPVNISVGGPLPQSLLQNSAGTAGAGAHVGLPEYDATPVPISSYIVVRDVLDYRLRIVPESIVVEFDNVGGTRTALPTQAGVQGPYWYLSTQLFTPVAGTPAQLPNNTTWAYNADRTTAGVNQQVQTFWIHITAAGLNEIANATGANAPLEFDAGDSSATPPVPATGFLFINFDTTARLIYNEYFTPLGPIINDGTLYFSRDPGVEAGDTTEPGDRTSYLLGLRINKVNPSNVRLDGAVFHLFRAEHMLADRSAPRTLNQADYDSGRYPGLNVGDTFLPVRRSISGEHILTDGTAAGGSGSAAGTWSPDLLDVLAELDYTGTLDMVTLPTPTPAEIQTYRQNLVNSGQRVGEAIFSNLPPGVYYLLEVEAPPGGYRRVATYAQVVLGEWCTDELRWIVNTTQTPAGSYHTLSMNMTNTRDFSLPLTGGAGTIMFTAAGVSLMGGAGLFLFLARKKEKTQK